jgi:serine/threonine protein phosphatase PrpC
LVRGTNEDSVFADADQGLVILADGMGGYNAGEVASNMATKLLSARLAAAFKATAAYQTDSRSGQMFAHRCLKEQIAAVNFGDLSGVGKSVEVRRDGHHAGRCRILR